MTAPIAIVVTPGIYYGAAYWMASMFFIYQSVQILHGWKRWLTHLFYLILLVGAAELAKQLPLTFFIPIMILKIVMMLLLISISCKCTLTSAGYFCVRAFILAEFAASFEWQIFFYMVSVGWFPPTFFVNIAFFLTIHFLVFGTAYLIEQQIRRDSEQLHITGRELTTAAIIGSFIYMLSNLSYVFQNTPFSSSESTEVFNTRTLVDLGGVAILTAYHLQLTEHHMKFELQKLHSLLQLQYQNFKISEQSINLVNQKYHDLKHQIAILRSGIDAHASIDYLDKLEDEIKIYETQNKTGNRILDTVIAGTDIHCQNRGICLTCVAEGAALNFMDPVDISTLFGNILDNAVECVEKLSEREKKLIHLSVSRQKSFLMIRSENFFEGPVILRNELPATTKPDSRYHGYGLKSIRNIAERYAGSMTIKAEGSWFEVRILIPIPKTN